MGLFDKLKNVLFEEETEEIPVITQEKAIEETKEIKEEIKEEPIKFRSVENYKPIEETKEFTVEEDNVSPFQKFDEEEFDRIATINKNRLIERDRRLREEKEREKEELDNFGYRERKHEYNFDRRPQTPTVEEKKEVIPPKRFTPSPVISPVYGILDKNYKKEDLLPRASSDGTLPKVIDVDTVRKKAFGTLEEDIETINNDIEEDLIKTSEIKITSFDDEELDKSKTLEELDEINAENEAKYAGDIEDIESVVDEETKEEEIEEEIPVPKRRKTRKVEEVEEPKTEDNAIEDELIDLIDSMYQDKED